MEKTNIKEIVDGVLKNGQKAAEYLHQGVIDAVDVIKEKANEMKTEMDRRKWQPLFITDLSNYRKPTLIRIIDSDSNECPKDVEVCEGSIGFHKETKEMKVLYLYREQANEFGVTFYPKANLDVYCIDSFHNNTYVSLDKFYEFARANRVEEMKTVAQKLGADRVEIEFYVEKMSFVSKSAKVTLKAGVKAKGKKQKKGAALHGAANAGHELINDGLEKYGHTTEAHFTGNSCVTDLDEILEFLVYLKDESSIVELIKRRVNVDNPQTFESDEFTIEKSCGINSNTAAQIEGTLKGLEIGGDASFLEESKKWEKMHLKYRMHFPENA